MEQQVLVEVRGISKGELPEVKRKPEATNSRKSL